jgi:hypothetical protein
VRALCATLGRGGRSGAFCGNCGTSSAFHGHVERSGPGGESDVPAWSASTRPTQTCCLICKKSSIV